MKKQAPKKSKTLLNIVFLGGLEEVGKNSTLYLSNKENGILVDCGLKFASSSKEPGASSVYIDYEYLKKHYEKQIKAIFITHAHLDHIGGLPYLLEFINVPIYCSRFAKGAIELLFQNHPKKFDVKFIPTIPNAKYTIKDIEVEFISMGHSIIESYGLSIKTPSGKIFHTGDYRIDYDAEEENKTDLKKIGKLAKEKDGFLATVSDSTNSFLPKQVATEKEVVEEVKKLLQEIKGRVVISCFSTQILRIKMLIEVCRKLNKKIFFAGRSLQNMVELSMELKIFKHEDFFIPAEQIKNVPEHNLVIFTTGSQGEPSSGLQLMSLDKHRAVKLTEKDTVIMSSSVIPGNELQIAELHNHLVKKGLKIITHRDRKIHVSGHGSKEEIKKIIEVSKPKYFIPVHGEPYQLYASRAIALELGYDEKDILLTGNGHSLQFEGGELKTIEKHKTKNMYKDGKNLNIIHTDLFKERNDLRENGALEILVIRKEGFVECCLKSKGFINRNENKEFFKHFKTRVEEAFKGFNGEIITEKDLVNLKKGIRNDIFYNTGKIPVIFLNIIENNSFFNPPGSSR